MIYLGKYVDLKYYLKIESTLYRMIFLRQDK